MKKTIAGILILMIIICACLPKTYGYTAPAPETLDQMNNGMLESNQNKLLFEGSVDSKDEEGDGSNKTVNQSSNWDTIASILSKVLILFPLVANKLMVMIATNGNGDSSAWTTLTKDYFTIDNLLQNKYSIFDINFFDVSSTDAFPELKKAVATWYVAIRNISIVGITIIAVYIGIRMALATVADSKAKYKQMLINWIAGIILLFLLQYIIYFAMSLSNLLIQTLMKSVENSGITTSIEEIVVSNVWDGLDSAQNGNETILYLILYYVLVIYEIKFFIMYFYRMLQVYFGMMIAPLVCMTYSIDKIKDKKAQAFNGWLGMMLKNIFIQPVHLFIYILFFVSASEIITKLPLLGVIFIITLSHAEQIVIKSFGLNFGGPGGPGAMSDYKLPMIGK